MAECKKPKKEIAKTQIIDEFVEVQQNQMKQDYLALLAKANYIPDAFKGLSAKKTDAIIVKSAQTALTKSDAIVLEALAALMKSNKVEGIGVLRAYAFKMLEYQANNAVTCSIKDIIRLM